jgi:hypothetical protein
MATGTMEAETQTKPKPKSKYYQLFAALAAPFDDDEVKINPRGLRYVTAQTVQNRLDDVLFPENWWAEYEFHPTLVACRLSIRLPDGTVLTKTNVGGYESRMEDPSDVGKTGVSDALKRAAVEFGVGRYFYRCGVPVNCQFKFSEPENLEDCFAKPQDPAELERARESEQEKAYEARSRKEQAEYRAERDGEAKAKEPAREPDGRSERPRGESQGQDRGSQRGRGQDDSRGSRNGYSGNGQSSRSGGNGSGGGGGKPFGPPRNGRQLCGWMGKQEQEHGQDVKKFLTEILKREGIVDQQGKPIMMINLNDADAVWVYEQVDGEFNRR